MSANQPLCESAPHLAEPRATELVPLIVDLDGTLINSDLLIESFLGLLSGHPLLALKTIFVLRHGLAAFKAMLGEISAIDPARLPKNEGLLAQLAEERARGRSLYIASAADQRSAGAVADHFGLFEGVFASDGRTNLKGTTKAEVLCRVFGKRGFDYAGNATADLAVWENAAGIMVVNPTPGLRRRVINRWPQAAVLGGRTYPISEYLRAMRPHQWLKNLLLFVPALTAHQFSFAVVSHCLLAFLSFSLCASSVYVLNDLVDLSRDRAHPTKCNRPFALGSLPLLHGVAVVPMLLIVSVLLAALIGPLFLSVLGGYYLLTLAYTFYLKGEVMMDIVALACLYELRLVAGGAAASIALSSWLAMFSIFLFCCLAIVKRCTELISRQGEGEMASSGRAYRLRDLSSLESLAGASGFTAVLVFALYLNQDTVLALYHHPHRLWLICVVLMYWIGRTLILMRRGVLHEDPVVFAATDRLSLACGAAVLAIILASL